MLTKVYCVRYDFLVGFGDMEVQTESWPAFILIKRSNESQLYH